TVRLLAAGAQVLPSEQPLDPTGAAKFYLTPLARGWLAAERVEVLHEGRKIQEIPLATKVVSRRRVWILLLLTILLPWFILAFLRYAPVTESIGKDRVRAGDIHRIERFVDANLPALPDVQFVQDNKELQTFYNDHLPHVIAGFIGDLIQLSREQPL